MTAWHVEGSASHGEINFGVEEMIEWISSLSLQKRESYVIDHMDDEDDDNEMVGGNK